MYGTGTEMVLVYIFFKLEPEVLCENLPGRFVSVYGRGHLTEGNNAAGFMECTPLQALYFFVYTPLSLKTKPL
jgi:hypothetical protein